jgi:hypothetical protein
MPIDFARETPEGLQQIIMMNYSEIQCIVYNLEQNRWDGEHIWRLSRQRKKCIKLIEKANSELIQRNRFK